MSPTVFPTIRDGLLGSAGIRIASLQDAVDLGDASDGDVASLTRWKQYRVALNRIEQQTGFPAKFDWPIAPS
ncbi:tail fiber assembly protein [Pseudomonas fluorescens]|uniref:tail fiber assembly protein n=1 Tax=Pseudomonas fluorescens TaxID=294 RepID=UPI001CD40406|nr:tail fiber assembly protein [Pseudomonas fluorescens]